LVAKTVITIAGVISVLLAIFVWKFALTKGFESPESEMVIYIILISTMVKGLAGPFLGVFTALREMAKYKIALLLGTVARLIGIVYVGLMHLDIFAFALVFVVEAVVILSISGFFFFRNHALARPTKRYFKSYISYAIPMAFVSIFSIAISNFGPVIIQLCFSSADVGFFSAALRIVGVIGIFTGALGTLLFPTLSALHANGDTKAMINLIFESERYLGVISFPLVFCSMALAIPIVSILLPGWLPAASILQILPLYLLFAAIEQPYLGHLLGSGNPKIVRNKMFMAACICIGLNILLVPRTLFGTPLAGLGALGSAIALIASSAAGWFYCRTMSQRLLTELKPFNKHLLLHFISAGIMAVIVFFITVSYAVVQWYSLLAIASLYFIGYIAILIAFKEFTRKDFSLILQMMNVKQLFQYVKDEIKK